MAFVDALTLEMVTLLLAAATVAYTAVMGIVEYHRRGAEGLRAGLRGSAGPLAFLGAGVFGLGMWGSIAWPLPGAYNILFSDVYVLFGMVLLAVAVSLFLGARLQYAGIFAAVAGAVTIDYGFQGYHLGLTKEPFEMFLLFAAFGVAAIAAFPATLVADRLLLGTPWGIARSAPAASPAGSLLGRFGRRAAQPVVPGTQADGASSVTTTFGMPRYATAVVLVFAVVMVGAAIAAMFFVGNTVPAHLASPP